MPRQIYLTIDKDRPIPRDIGRAALDETKRIAELMEIGDSIEFPRQGRASYLCTTLKALGRRGTIRKSKNAWRVWRIE